MPNATDNQRKFARAVYLTTASIEVDGKTIECLTKNLTPEGMLITSDESLTLGQNITISFCLPDSDASTRIGAQIVRLVGEHTGVKFDEPLEVFFSH